MKCELAREKLAAYAQERLSGWESSALRSHLLECEGCYQEYEYQERLESPLRELAAAEPPAALSTAIRLELSRRCVNWWEHWQVRLSNVMEPLALPAAGGLLTALILFGSFVPALSVSRASTLGEDVPTILSTTPKFKTASPFHVSEDVTVEAWIDEQGRVADFELLNAPRTGRAAQQVRLQSGNVMLTTVFEPATRFGQPIAGRVVFSLHTIDIRP